jgi:hypothetical protein
VTGVVFVLQHCCIACNSAPNVSCSDPKLFHTQAGIPEGPLAVSFREEMTFVSSIFVGVAGAFDG